MNYAWSQLANPLPEKKRRNDGGLLLFSDHEDRVFDGDAGPEASVSNVLDGMMTKNGVLMQFIINTVKVTSTVVLIERSIYKGIHFQSLLQLTFWAFTSYLPESV